MRFNYRQLLYLSNEKADLEDRLNFKKITTGASSSNNSFKERWFKLKYNLLFYFKFNDAGQIESKPAGVFVLEGADVRYESNGGSSFCFSLTFLGEQDKKYIFAARSEATVNRWIEALRAARYEEWRRKLILLRQKLKIDSEKHIVSKTVVHTPSLQGNLKESSSHAMKKDAHPFVEPTAKFYNTKKTEDDVVLIQF